MKYPVVHLILKRIRTPLILLILAYSIAIAGMAIIPGIDAEGNPVHLSIFESFYFISYVATTIGFGEIPYQFTDMQRLWVVFCIYLTVISWLVAIGNIISLLKNPELQGVWRRQRFIKSVNRIKDEFFIICGYGEAGEILLDNLSAMGHQCVVIDSDIERINLLDLNNSHYGVLHWHGDAGNVEMLRMAGLESPYCRAVIAITNDDDINVKISVATKVLRSNVKTICRANNKDAIANAKSFDSDFVVSSNRIYAENMARAFRTPSVQQLSMSLLRRSGRDYARKLTLPRGHWLVCGYDDFGQEIARFLDFEGMDYTVISPEACQENKHVSGKGTEAVTLRDAGIDKAVGLIAGTDNDADNFSIVITARQLKPNLYMVARQNEANNRPIFHHMEIDTIVEAERLLVWYIMPVATQPVFARFLHLVRHQNEDWGKALMQRLKELSNKVPSTYLVKINAHKSPALMGYLASGNILRLQEIYIPDSEQPGNPVALPLMLIRDEREELLPKLSTAINEGDVFLMASSDAARRQVKYTITHEQDFYYVLHGREKPVSIVLQAIKNYLKHYKNYRRSKKIAAQKNGKAKKNRRNSSPSH